MEIDAITETIILSTIEVHRALGPGLLETAYSVCLTHEIGKRGLRVRREVEIPIEYDGVQLETGFRLDLLVGETVIVELKAKTAITPVDEAQILSYLRLARKPVGLLLNFHVPLMKDGIRRFRI